MGLGVGFCPSSLTPSTQHASHSTRRGWQQTLQQLLDHLEACDHKTCLQYLWLLSSWQLGVPPWWLTLRLPWLCFLWCYWWGFRTEPVLLCCLLSLG